MPNSTLVKSPYNGRERRTPPDPTENTKDLMEAGLESAKDLISARLEMMSALRTADKELRDGQSAHLKEIAELRANHADKLRAGDVTAATSSAISLATAVSTLAAATDRNNETLRTQVASTAAIMAKQTSDMAAALALASENLFRRVDERVVVLERATASNLGRLSVTDPQMADYMKDLKAVLLSQSNEGGKEKGISLAWGILIAAGLLVTGMVSVGLSVYSIMKP